MNTDNETRKRSKFAIFSVIHRFLRVVLTPFIFVSLCIITLSAIISLPIWIISGKTLIPYTVEFARKHVEFCWG